MPMTFTDAMVEQGLKRHDLPIDNDPQERRERLAQFINDEYQDHLEAWEIRTGRPWNDMTVTEARSLLIRHPKLIRNPGLLSRLIQGATA